jgi:hypothetical protein
MVMPVAVRTLQETGSLSCSSCQSCCRVVASGMTRITGTGFESRASLSANKRQLEIEDEATVTGTASGASTDTATVLM